MGPDRQSILTALALVALLAGTVHGQRAPSQRAEAVKHFEQAEAYFLARAFDQAAREYQAAYDLVPKPGLLFNVGLCRENLGDATGAVEAYRRYLELDPRGTKGVEARARLAALELKLADQREAARRAREEEEAEEAEEERRPLGVDASRELPAPPVSPGPRASFLPGLLVLGGAAGAGAIGLGYQMQARSIRNDLDRELDNGTPPLDSRDPRFDQGRTAALRSSIAYGAAGALGAVGAFLTARAILRRRSPAPEVSVRPAVAPAHAGVALELAW